MSRISPGLYGQWRARRWAAPALAERPDSALLSERLLQLIWAFQRLRREPLQTTDGQLIRILHPGFWNHEPGPDFRNAVVQWGDALARSGDIEIDLSTRGWHAHGHDQNPNYRGVILHVVWEPEPPALAPASTLALKPFLDAPLEELALWLRNEPTSTPANVPGECAAPLGKLSIGERSDLLHDAARIRLQSKAVQLQARGREAGWEQALWEGIFGALGYKNNIWAMRRVADLLPRLRAPNEQGLSTLALQARLLGVSGLLPAEVDGVRAGAQAYLRQIWNLWWRERESFADVILPRELWHLSSLRPANHPQRRLALAAHWLTRVSLTSSLEQWFASVTPDSKMPRSLAEVLQTPEDPFWSRHWTVNSAPMPEPQPLIGPPRLTDLAINVILPWFWIRAVLGQNERLQRLAEACYFAWPKAEDNTVLRLARDRLFGRSVLVDSGTAAMQQAVLQIVRDFCDESNALCVNCPFPELVGG